MATYSSSVDVISARYKGSCMTANITFLWIKGDLYSKLLCCYR